MAAAAAQSPALNATVSNVIARGKVYAVSLRGATVGSDAR
jgi:hypothetical protein